MMISREWDSLRSLFNGLLTLPRTGNECGPKGLRVSGRVGHIIFVGLTEGTPDGSDTKQSEPC